MGAVQPRNHAHDQEHGGAGHRLSVEPTPPLPVSSNQMVVLAATEELHADEKVGLPVARLERLECLEHGAAMEHVEDMAASVAFYEQLGGRVLQGSRERALAEERRDAVVAGHLAALIPGQRPPCRLGQ